MDVRVARVAEEHDGLVPWRALLAAGLSERQAARAATRLRRLHDGVFLTGQGRITRHQRWLAASLTTPETALSHASAGALFGFRPWEAASRWLRARGAGGHGGSAACSSAARAPSPGTSLRGTASG